MSLEYDAYISEHKRNVKKSYDWLSENLPRITRACTRTSDIDLHDSSKYWSSEYNAYDAYFYGEKTEKVKEEFNRAWLGHIHCNPHHWQYWVLINDDPKNGHVAIEMDYDYVIEMICDWWSFSWKTGNLYEIFDWYDKHKSYMILHENTRRIVEDILTKIREILDNENK